MAEKDKTEEKLRGEIKLLQKRITELEKLNSEHKQGATYREMGQKILQMLNEPGSLKVSIHHVLSTIKTQMGFDAVGIRLQEGDDFPYFTQEGFPEDFMLKENSLFERAADGGVCRNPDGSPRLECTCGMVLCGKTAQAGHSCTPGGSFWTNDSLPLLEIPLDQDPRYHPRNECIHQGYASVALVPIKIRDKIVGLIHLNDRRKGFLTLETVELLERIGLYIGTALMRKQAEDLIKDKLAEIEKLNKFMSEREMRIIEVKKEVNKLCKELGRSERYGV